MGPGERAALRAPVLVPRRPASVRSRRTVHAGPRDPSGRPIFAPRRFPVAVESVAFSPDGSVLVVGLQDGSAVVLALPSGKLIRTIKATRDDVLSVAFAPDGTLATGTWAGIVQRWNVS